MLTGRASCFNEAEAIKPRNPTHTPDHLRRVPRFNEAEAIKPRNRAGISTARRVSRRCFNEAEAIKPRNLEFARKNGIKEPELQ